MKKETTIQQFKKFWVKTVNNYICDADYSGKILKDRSPVPSFREYHFIKSWDDLKYFTKRDEISNIDHVKKLLNIDDSQPEAAPTPLEVNEGKQPANTVGEWTKGILFLDHGDNESELLLRIEITDNEDHPGTKESFDIASFESDETENVKPIAARIVECWNGYDVIKMQLKLTDQQAAEYGRENEALKKELETGANQYAAKVMENEALKSANRELLEALKNFMIGVAGIASVPKGSTITTGFPAEFFETASLLISKHSKQTT